MIPPTVPPDADPAGPEAPPAAPPSAIRPIHLIGVAAAVAGGALVTLLLLDARPAARDVAPAVSPDPAALPRPALGGMPALDPSAPPKWSSKQQSRWVNPSRRSAAFEVAAERPVAVWNGTVTPALVVRCASGKVDVFVYTQSAARIEPEDDNHTVKLVFDDGGATHERWPDSIEHDALFAPEGRALAARLSEARSFAFTFAPHNASPATAYFDVRGLKQTMAASRACR